MPTLLTARQKRLWELYRLTEEEWNVIFQFQNRICPITLKSPGNIAFNTDHCHDTGLIRGLLSPFANKGLAYLDDDPAQLRRAADYLDNPPAVTALGRKVFGLLGRAKRKKVMVYGQA